MSNFHISKDGVARKCQAATPEACRATKTDMKEHFETREEAQKAYEEKMKNKGVGSVKKQDKAADGNKRAEELLKRTQANAKFEESLRKIEQNVEKMNKQMLGDQRKAVTQAKKEWLQALPIQNCSAAALEAVAASAADEAARTAAAAAAALAAPDASTIAKQRTGGAAASLPAPRLGTAERKRERPCACRLEKD